MSFEGYYYIVFSTVSMLSFQKENPIPFYLKDTSLSPSQGQVGRSVPRTIVGSEHCQEGFLLLDFWYFQEQENECLGKGKKINDGFQLVFCVPWASAQKSILSKRFFIQVIFFQVPKWKKVAQPMKSFFAFSWKLALVCCNFFFTLVMEIGGSSWTN